MSLLLVGMSRRALLACGMSCTERIGTHTFRTKLLKTIEERMRNVEGTYRNVIEFNVLARGLHGTYRNV